MDRQEQLANNAEETYSPIRGCIITAQNKVSSAVNTAMVLAAVTKEKREGRSGR